MKKAKLYILCTLIVLLCCSCVSASSQKTEPESSPSFVQAESIRPIESQPEIIEPTIEEKSGLEAAGIVLPEGESLVGEEPITEEAPVPEETPQVTYILNTNSKKFHKPSCRSAQQISPKNYAESFDTRENIIAQGYSSCGNCKP